MTEPQADGGKAGGRLVIHWGDREMATVAVCGQPDGPGHLIFTKLRGRLTCPRCRAWLEDEGVREVANAPERLPGGPAGPLGAG